MNGYIHSFQSMGAADGPGLRCVVFMQGCPLRCLYCHNPDSWESSLGAVYTAREIVSRALRFKPYFGKTGGVTVSGGEPLLQAEFVCELFKLLHKEKIKTALDTSGAVSSDHIKPLLEHTDLVICDIKFPTQQQYKKYSGGNLDTVLKFLTLVQELDIPLWVRHVIVPGLTDSKDNIRQIAAIAKSFSNLKKIELLPFRKLCLSKYEQMGIEFSLADVPECPPETLKSLNETLDKLLK